MIIDKTFIETELAGLYGATVLQDLNEILRLYRSYDGHNDEWADQSTTLDYAPIHKRTNHIKKLIKAESRFMFGRTPEFTIVPKDKKDQAGAELIQDYIDGVLDANKFSDRLIKGARDCLIGKRVALKLWAAPQKTPSIQFRPSLEFVYDIETDDSDKVKKAVFFYQINNEIDKSAQRIFKQRFEMVGGKSLVSEYIYDGLGTSLETRYENLDTGLDFLPVYIIINDGLSGDLSGESDVADIRSGQKAYNKLGSDDVDALKFNMFPMKVAMDVSADSLKKAKIAPGALIDGQTEAIAADSNKQGNLNMLEAQFSYDQRFENAINRIKGDMHELLSVPNIGLEQLKGLMQSGKSMRALYWELICRCEEKWATWEPALQWMIKSLLAMAKAYSLVTLPEVDYTVKIEHLYPIMEDENEEKANDLAEVVQGTRSRKSYLEKWRPDEDSDMELGQIMKEKSMFEDSFVVPEPDGPPDPNNPPDPDKPDPNNSGGGGA